MKGFAHRTTVDDAIRWVDETARSWPAMRTENCSLNKAAGRILAEDVYSTVHVPGFQRSMMDGFALRAEDTQGAAPYNPLSFRIIATALPGQVVSIDAGPGQAVRIMTGAPLPKGTDAVLPVEYTESTGETLLASGEVSPGKHVGGVGEDILEGSKVLSAGRRLRPQDLGVLSSIGHSVIPVLARPRVRVLITGNELLPAGSRPVGVRISDANGPMLTALIQRDGGIPDCPGLIPDDPVTLLDVMQEPADVILISGGSSTGQEDHAPRLLAEHGQLAIHGLAMRPSSPAGMGRLRTSAVFLLPGNPVSCLCAYDFFAGRLIRQLAGQSANWPYRCRKLPLNRKLVSVAGRVDYARVRITSENAEVLAVSGASVLSSTTQSDGFVVVPADSEGFPEGTVVDVWLYD
jgi:molybdopterin molybdotransferase